MEVPQNLKPSATTPVSSTLEEEEDTMRFYVCVRVIDCVFKISYVHIRQQSESVGLSCPNLNLIHPIRKVHKDLKSYGSAATLNHALKYM
jgi:hypothetical protein